MGGGGSSPQPPKFKPVDIDEALGSAEAYQRQTFKLADDKYLEMFPGLVRGNQSITQSSYDNLFGPTAPETQNQLATRSIENALSATGGNDPMATIGGEGTASGNSFGLNLTDMFNQKQDYDRSAWQQVVGANPLRDIAPGGSEAANLSIFNTQGQAGAAQALYSSQVGTANAKSAASAANTQAAIGASIAVAGIIATII